MNVDDADYDHTNDDDDVAYDDHDEPECHSRIINKVAPTNTWINSFLSSRDRAR